MDRGQHTCEDIQSPSMMIRRRSGRSISSQVGETADLYRTVRKARYHLQLADHGFDVATKRGEVQSVRFSSLVLDVQDFGQHLLR